MDVNVKISGELAVIKLAGRFDFNAHREFREGVEKALADRAVTRVELDLADVAYLDSSALGMLLMVRDKARSGNRTVNLVNARGSVRQVLDIANFSKLFTIT